MSGVARWRVVGRTKREVGSGQGGYEPIYCIWWPKSFRPIRLILRRVRRMVDILLGGSNCPGRIKLMHCGWSSLD